MGYCWGGVDTQYVLLLEYFYFGYFPILKDSSYAIGKKQQNLGLLDILVYNSINIPSF